MARETTVTFTNRARRIFWTITIALLPITITPLGVAVILALYIYLLAKNNVFFTIVQETTVKFITSANQLVKPILAYTGHCFKYENDPNKDFKDTFDKWEIVKVREDVPSNSQSGLFKKIFHEITFGILRNVYWVGIYPNMRIASDRFTWTSREQNKDTGEFELKPDENENQDYMLVRKDFYAFRINEANTQNMLPLDVTVVIQVQIKNPVKARFNIEHWLEAITNELNAEIRSYIGELDFNQVNKLVGKKLEERVAYLLKKFKNHYGVEVSVVTIVSVDPASHAAEKALEAELAVFTANQTAKANRIEGRGLKDRAKSLYGEVSSIPGGVGMFTAEALRDSKITTYAPGEKGGLTPTIDVSNDVPQPTETTT